MKKQLTDQTGFSSIGLNVRDAASQTYSSRGASATHPTGSRAA